MTIREQVWMGSNDSTSYGRMLARAWFQNWAKWLRVEDRRSISRNYLPDWMLQEDWTVSVLFASRSPAPAWYLAHTKCSVNIYWRKTWINDYSNRRRQQYGADCGVGSQSRGAQMFRLHSSHTRRWVCWIRATRATTIPTRWWHGGHRWTCCFLCGLAQ